MVHIVALLMYIGCEHYFAVKMRVSRPAKYMELQALAACSADTKIRRSMDDYSA